MEKSEILDLLMLLSALESWSFSEKKSLPDYLHEKLSDSVTVLSKALLDGSEDR